MLKKLLNRVKSPSTFKINYASIRYTARTFTTEVILGKAD